MALNENTASGYPSNLGGTFKERTDSPTVDNVFIFSSGGKIWERVFDSSNTLYRASWLKTTTAPANLSALVQIALNDSRIQTLEIDTPITLDSNITATGKILKFLKGGIISGAGVITGGIIDAPYHIQIFSPTTIINPEGVYGEWLSVKWFGAIGNNSNNDQPAIQATVDLINRNNGRFTVAYLPVGNYRTNSPIACAKFNTDTLRYEQVYVTLKGEGEGYSSKFPARGSVIRPTFKNAPAIYWQLGKSGGMESISIIGAYTVPTLTAAQFYNADLASYGDPTCRDERYSPYCAIAIDAVRYGTLPPDGGYPGLNYGATGMTGSTSGSSGLSFKDVYISNFTVCVIFSPNGQTQNDDCITFEDLRIGNYKVGIASCQDQEKGNKLKSLVAWGDGHTFLDNVTYGAGTAGNIYLDGANLAGFNNQFMNWSTGGRFSSFIENVYAESLGKFGTATTNSSQITIKDCIWRWAEPGIRGSYYADWHINASRGVEFQGCSFMVYGFFYPTVLHYSGLNSSSPTFDDCYFDSFPVTWPQQAQGVPVFKNCSAPSGARIGVAGPITSQFGSSIKSWANYGSYTIGENSVYANNATGRRQVIVNNPNIYRSVNSGSSVAVTIAGDRTFTVTLSAGNAPYFTVNSPVYLNNGTTYIFAGLVSSIDAGANTVTVKFVPQTITDATYASIWAMCASTLYGFMGNTTFLSNQITLYTATQDIGISVGDLIISGVFGATNCAMVTNISGTTITTNKNATMTLSGVYFCSPGLTRKFINPSFNTDTASYSANTILPVGSLIESNSFGVVATRQVTKTGFNNAAAVGGGETRQAEWTTISLPTVIDRFTPGDVGKPANGATVYQNDYLKGVGIGDFTIDMPQTLVPNLVSQLSYTFVSSTGAITITNGTFDINIPVTIKGR